MKSNRPLIKLPRGTQDYDGDSYKKLEYLKNEIISLYKKYHGEFIESPVFELTDVLMDKYGEDEKLIYNLESDQNTDHDIDQNTDENSKEGEELSKERLSLRYDHTVPLVRYCLMNKIDKMRRCCIGKVYRREATTRSQIRLREFHQADFDYVGQFDELIPELEIFCMIQELFKKLNINNYQILYNYRQNLDFYIKDSKIIQKFSTICSSIDKLDKKDPEEIRKELLEKGCSDEQINSLYSFLFSKEHVFSPLVRDFDKKFNEYIDKIKILDKSKIIFMPTLARGSDYYTGIIFEVKLTETNFTSSVTGGGRYDELIPSYKKNNVPGETFPMIGFSFGIDRLLPFVKLPDNSKTNNKLWVSTIGKNFFDSGKILDPVAIKLDLIGKLLLKNYSVYYNLSQRKFSKEIGDASAAGCNFIIIIGETEFAENKITIKDLIQQKQTTIDFEQIDSYFN
jgi:histidyl-tRNA synthetase